MSMMCTKFIVGLLKNIVVFIICCVQTGKPGEAGNKGPEGGRGQPGPEGLAGEPGPRGMQGDRGVPGLSGAQGRPVRLL